MIFMSGNTPSSKNSRQRTKAGFFITSKTVQKYLKEHESQWESVPEEFKISMEKESYPIIVGFHFVRNSKHRWDFTNIVQICADLMTKYGWIPDDNMDYFIPQVLWIDEKHYSYNKESPGVFIKIIN
jgi:hypothetical protein